MTVFYQNYLDEQALPAPGERQPLAASGEVERESVVKLAVDFYLFGRAVHPQLEKRRFGGVCLVVVVDAAAEEDHPVVEAEYRFTGNKIRSEVFQITLH